MNGTAAVALLEELGFKRTEMTVPMLAAVAKFEQAVLTPGLRDDLAKTVLAALLPGASGQPWEYLALTAYGLADEMLKARETTPFEKELEKQP